MSVIGSARDQIVLTLFHSASWLLVERTEPAFKQHQA
jgi:hypothetical protein